MLRRSASPSQCDAKPTKFHRNPRRIFESNAFESLPVSTVQQFYFQRNPPRRQAELRGWAFREAGRE
eukprot:4937914-Pyramimonas_sp.AAC.1